MLFVDEILHECNIVIDRLVHLYMLLYEITHEYGQFALLKHFQWSDRE